VGRSPAVKADVCNEARQCGAQTQHDDGQLPEDGGQLEEGSCLPLGRWRSKLALVLSTHAMRTWQQLASISRGWLHVLELIGESFQVIQLPVCFPCRYHWQYRRVHDMKPEKQRLQGPLPLLPAHPGTVVLRPCWPTSSGPHQLLRP
jgi:hypothetical protein